MTPDERKKYIFKKCISIALGMIMLVVAVSASV